MPPKSPKTAAAGRLIGYARVSTDEQGTDPQRDELGAAGCATILEEHASGADRSRPVLARLLRDIAAGETLVVVRLDRLARSVSHLLGVIEQLEARGAHFRSLCDPIDTTTPQGMFSLQVLGAVAQLERALIAERTKSGLNAARVRGRVGGNPGLRAGDPNAIRKVRASRDAAHLAALIQRIAAIRKPQLYNALNPRIDPVSRPPRPLDRREFRYVRTVWLQKPVAVRLCPR